MYTHLQERHAARPPVNISMLNRMKADQQKIACVTAYDASFAALVDDAGLDVVLVGYSLGMVIQGHGTTVPVTLEDVIYIMPKLCATNRILLSNIASECSTWCPIKLLQRVRQIEVCQH